MQKRTKRLITGVPGVFLTICLLSGMAMIRKNKAIEQEQILSSSGFHMERADTPDELAKIAAMPQRKLVAKKLGNKIEWSYADSKYCKCVFTGNEKEYQRFKGEASVRWGESLPWWVPLPH